MEQCGKETSNHEKDKQYIPNFCFRELGKTELFCMYPDGSISKEMVDMSVRKNVHGLTFRDGELYVIASDSIEEEHVTSETEQIDQEIPITELAQDDEHNRLSILRTVIGGAHGRRMQIFTHEEGEITGGYLYTIEGDEETHPAIVVETGMEHIETRDGGGQMPATHSVPTNHIETLIFP